MFAAHVTNDAIVAENLERLGTIAKTRDHEYEIGKRVLLIFCYILFRGSESLFHKHIPLL